MAKYSKTFQGGYKFVNFLGQPQDKIINLEVPREVMIPLRQNFGSEVPAVVKVGDYVKAGQIIGRDGKSVSSPVHATVSGQVKEIVKKNYFQREVTFITIEGDGSPEWEKLDFPEQAWRLYTEEELEQKLYLSGITGAGHSGIPTRHRSSVIGPRDVKHLIIHGVGSEAYNISLNVLLGGKAVFHFMEGLVILKKIMAEAKVYLALNIKDKKLAEEISKLTADLPWLEIYRLEPKYPQGYDEMLVPTLLHKNFPYGYSAANIGVIVLDIQTVLQAYEAVAEGKPLIERTIALCGSGFKENLHVKARVGTPLREVIKNYLSPELKVRIILNGLMTGPKLNDYGLPVDHTYSQIIAVPENATRQFLSFLRPGLHFYSYSSAFLTCSGLKKYPDTNLHGEARPCISCSYCEEVCPVRIIPHLLSKMVKKNITDERLMKYGIFNCIECNLCTFVCPSKIPLAQDIKEGKEKLMIQGCDQSQCVLPYFNLKGLEEYRGIK